MKLAKGIRISIFSIGIGLITGTTLAYILLGTFINEAIAQTPYLNSKSTKVAMGDNSTAYVFCNDGDGMLSGGYSTGFSSTHSAFDTMVYSNHPTQVINQTGYFEGWEAGLVNKGNSTAEITAMAFCINLTLTP